MSARPLPTMVTSVDPASRLAEGFVSTVRFLAPERGGGACVAARLELEECRIDRH